MTDEEAGAEVEVTADDAPVSDAAAATAVDTAGTDAGVTTGVPAVDDVLGTLEGLADQPVEEHLPIFEAAHERLRSALDPADTGDEPVSH